MHNIMKKFLTSLYAVVMHEFLCMPKIRKNYTHAGRADVECSKSGLKEHLVFCEFSR